MIKNDGFDHSTLLKEDLAQVCISFVVKRADSNAQPFDVWMTARRLKSITSQSSMEMAGTAWQAGTDGNDGMPPMCQACDNHPTQVAQHRMFLGLLPRKDIDGVVFFQNCHYKRRFIANLHLYIFSTLYWNKKYPIFNVNDPPHTQKGEVRSLKVPARLTEVDGFRVSGGCLVLGGMPLLPYRGYDMQVSYRVFNGLRVAVLS